MLTWGRFRIHSTAVLLNASHFKKKRSFRVTEILYDPKT